MKLSWKVFWYSSVLFLVFMCIWSSYMFFMLPSLYRAQMLTNQKSEMKQMLTSYQEENRTCKTNDTHQFMYETIKIPKSGNTIQLCGVYGIQDVEFHSDRTQNILHKIQSITQLDENTKDIFNEVVHTSDLETIRNDWLKEKSQEFTIQMIDSKPVSRLTETDGDIDVNLISDKMLVGTASVQSTNGIYYINTVGLLLTDEGVYIALAPSVISEATSILPTIVESLPMFIVVFILLLLGFTMFFTKYITRPIELLSKRATNLRKGYDSHPIVYHGKDEIRDLSEAVEAMYQEIYQNYQVLMNKNEQLKIEKERQRSFLLATSHELKTPIATGRLLVDGMIDQVGKYKDTSRYLPEVNQELKRMQTIVSHLLDAYEQASFSLEHVDVGKCIIDICQVYTYLKEERAIQISIKATENEVFLQTSKQLLTTIIDNMISNAIHYADDESTIEIQLMPTQIVIFNTCPPIPERVLATLGKQVVLPNRSDGSGVGLYLTFQYCAILNIELEVDNTSNGVKQTLTFK